MLDLAEEIVVLAQQHALLVGQAAALFQPGHGLQRVAGPQLGQVGAVEQLQELDHELDVANAAVADLHVADLVVAVDLLLDPPLQGLDAADVGPAQVTAVDPGRKLREELVAQVQVAGNGPGLDVSLPLPGAAADVVIREHRRQAHHHRPSLPIGPQPQIDAVDHAQLGVLGQKPDELAGQVLEELVVAHGPRTVGLALAVVEKDQVDIAGIVQLAAAELAHAEDDEAGRLAVRADGVAPLRADLSPGRAEGPFENGVGQVGNLRRDRLQALVADDIAIGDPQRLAAFETPQRTEHRLLVLQGRDFRHQVLDEHLPGHRRPFGQPQQVEALRVGDQQVREVLARGKDLDQRGQRRGVAFEERADAQRIAGLGHEAVQVVERHVGIGATGQEPGRVDRRSRPGDRASRPPRPCHQGRVGAAEIDHSQAHSRTPARRRHRRGSGEGWRYPCGQAAGKRAFRAPANQ